MAAPLITKLCFAAALCLSIALAFFGPPPKRWSRATTRILAVIAAAWFGLAGFALVDGRGATWVAGLLFAAVETTCLAAWTARFRPEPDDDGPPEGPDPPGTGREEPYTPLWAGHRDPSPSGSRLWHDG